jgi:hypothetical protein
VYLQKQSMLCFKIDFPSTPASHLPTKHEFAAEEMETFGKRNPSWEFKGNTQTAPAILLTETPLQDFCEPQKQHEA